MDEVIRETYARFSQDHDCSADDIACCPVLRTQFVAIIQSHRPDTTEEVILRRLLYLRKKSRLPTRAA
jgi:hypothetical protein